MRSLEARTIASLRNHYSVNAFLCESNTNFTLFRPRKVVSYVHGRNLAIGEKLTLRRAVSTNAKDIFVVQAIQINKTFDFVILEGDEDMHVSCPVLCCPNLRPSIIPCFHDGALSFQKVEMKGFTEQGCAFWKGVWTDKPCGNPEGSGCYEDWTREMTGVCVSCKALSPVAEGSGADIYEYMFTVGGVFF